MGGQPVNFSDVTFFELDRLFAASRRALRRKLKRRRRQGDGGESVASRSRTPTRRLLGRSTRLGPFGGFTSAVEKVERTIIAATLPSNADEKVVYDFFTRCGPVTDVKILRTRSGVQTGIVVVEFAEEDAVTCACNAPPEINVLLGVTLQIKRADAQLQKGVSGQRRPMTAKTAFTQHVLTGLKTGGSDQVMRKLHIKNLRAVVTEEDMRGIFRPFGDFDKFEMGSQECWITFGSPSDAQDAMTSMQGFHLVGQELQIAVQSATPPPRPIMLGAPSTADRMDLTTDSDFGATSAGLQIGGNQVTSRIQLMQKLLSSHSQQGVPTVVGLAPPAASGALAAANPDPSLINMPPTPKPGTSTSRTLLLQNMFQPGSVDLLRDPRFYEEIREDTHDECTKFGKVQHITVDPRGTTGLIYVLFEGAPQRLAAEMALNGRWFEGKKIVAMGIDDAIWQALAAQAQAPAQAPAQ